MSEKERVKIERIDTKDPENAVGIFVVSTLFAGFEKIAPLLFGDKEAFHKESLSANFKRNMSYAEKLADLMNEESFLVGCREFEDRIEETQNEEERNALKQRFDEYKREWEKQNKREKEDREIRDKRKELRKSLGNKT